MLNKVLWPTVLQMYIQKILEKYLHILRDCFQIIWVKVTWFKEMNYNKTEENIWFFFTIV